MGCKASSISHTAPEAVDQDKQCRYEFSEALGKGAFGTVLAGRHRSSGKQCAVKIVNLTVDDRTQDGRKRKRLSETKQQAARAELDVWEILGRHPNLVKLIDSYEAMGNCFMVMEKCDCSLAQKLDQDPSFLGLDPGRVFREMLQGVQACHSLAIVHRDVKLPNFLISGGASGRPSMKLCDFGLATCLPPKGWLRGECGTVPMMSPEMVSAERYAQGTDVWSFGATMYLALFRELPYPSEDATPSSMKAAIVQGLPPRCLEEVRQGPRETAVGFLRQLLERDSSKRCTAKQGLMHAYLAGGEHSEATLEGKCVTQVPSAGSESYSINASTTAGSDSSPLGYCADTLVMQI